MENVSSSAPKSRANSPEPNPPASMNSTEKKKASSMAPVNAPSAFFCSPRERNTE